MRYKHFLLISALLFLAACRINPEPTQEETNTKTEEKTDISDSSTTVKTIEAFIEDNKPLISVHRGGGDANGYPENAIESFEYFHKQFPVVIECDIIATKDGELILLHDETLNRTTNKKGKVSEMNWSAIQDATLVDNYGGKTTYKIPTLEEALNWGKNNRAYFTLDIKRGVPFEDVINAVRKTGMDKQVALITYTLPYAEKVHRLAPDLMLSCTIRNFDELKRYENSKVNLDNIIAFVGTKKPQNSLYKALHNKGIYCILGTLGNLDRQAKRKGDKLYKQWAEDGADILATDRAVDAARMLK